MARHNLLIETNEAGIRPSESLGRDRKHELLQLNCLPLGEC